jgi:hypothetical protein
MMQVVKMQVTYMKVKIREHLWEQAGTGLLGDHVVAIGPWWRSGGQDQIDAVVLAQPELTRIPVAVGECRNGANRSADPGSRRG